MHEFEIGGIRFQSRKLDPFKQLHVARRMAPVMVGLGMSIDPDTGKPKFSNPFATLVPAVEVLSNMSDADVEYVTKTCCSVVFVEREGKWHPLYRGGALMFNDIGLDMFMLLMITWEVGQDNLSGFTAILPSIFPPAPSPKESSSSDFPMETTSSGDQF